MLRLNEVRPCDHHLCTAGVQPSLNDICKVIFVGLLAVIDASKDRITQIYADLSFISIVTKIPISEHTSAYLSGLGSAMFAVVLNKREAIAGL